MGENNGLYIFLWQGLTIVFPQFPFSVKKQGRTFPRLLLAQRSHVTMFWANWKLKALLCRTGSKAPKKERV